VVLGMMLHSAELNPIGSADLSAEVVSSRPGAARALSGPLGVPIARRDRAAVLLSNESAGLKRSRSADPTDGVASRNGPVIFPDEPPDKISGSASDGAGRIRIRDRAHLVKADQTANTSRSPCDCAGSVGTLNRAVVVSDQPATPSVAAGTIRHGAGRVGVLQ